jgi:hypothetical protein
MVEPARQPNEDLELTLGRALAYKVVPEEAPFFDEFIAAAGASKVHRKDRTLGFGGSVEDIGATCLVLYTLSRPLLHFIWENAKDSAGHLIRDTAESVRISFENHLRRWLDGGLTEPPPLKLPPDKVARIIEQLKKDAASLGLDEAASKHLETVLRNSFL